MITLSDVRSIEATTYKNSAGIHYTVRLSRGPALRGILIREDLVHSIWSEVLEDAKKVIQ